MDRKWGATGRQYVYRERKFVHWTDKPLLLVPAHKLEKGCFSPARRISAQVVVPGKVYEDIKRGKVDAIRRVYSPDWELIEAARGAVDRAQEHLGEMRKQLDEAKEAAYRHGAPILVAEEFPELTDVENDN